MTGEIEEPKPMTPGGSHKDHSGDAMVAAGMFVAAMFIAQFVHLPKTWGPAHKFIVTLLIGTSITLTAVGLLIALIDWLRGRIPANHG